MRSDAPRSVKHHGLALPLVLGVLSILVATYALLLLGGAGVSFEDQRLTTNWNWDEREGPLAIQVATLCGALSFALLLGSVVVCVRRASRMPASRGRLLIASWATPLVCVLLISLLTYWGLGYL